MIAVVQPMTSAGTGASRRPVVWPTAKRWPDLSPPERAVLREVVIHGPLTRTQIAARLGQSRASLTKVVRSLVAHELVQEGGVQQRSRLGRPSELLRVREEWRVLGVKLTGDRAFAVVTDLQARVLARLDRPIRDRAPEAVASLLVEEMVPELVAQGGAPVALGLCLAGDVKGPAGAQRAVDSAYLGWDDVPLTQLVADRLTLPVVAENDVRGLTAAEHWFGAAAGSDSIALVTVGAGIGLGVVVGGSLYRGSSGRAARLDHLLVDPAGRVCSFGHRGCVSTFLTSSAIVDSFGVPGLGYDDVVALARQGDPAAERVFDEAGYALGHLVGTVANAFDPASIILTGEGLPVVELARRAMLAGIDVVRQPVGADTPLRVHPFDFIEWARGGAVVAIQHLVRDLL